MPLRSANQRQCSLMRSLRILALPPQQQPGPLEMMPGLQHPALRSRHRFPLRVEELAQAAALYIDEVRERELDNLFRKRKPVVRTADLCPGEARFQQMHVRIRLKWQLRRIAGIEPECVLALQDAHHNETQAIRLS